MPSEKNNRIHTLFLVVKYSTYGCIMLLNLYLTYHNHHWQGVIPFFFLLMINGLMRDWLNLSIFSRTVSILLDLFLIGAIGWVMGASYYYLLFFPVMAEAVLSLPRFFGFTVIIVAFLVNGIFQLYIVVFLLRLVELQNAIISYIVFFFVLLFISFMSFISRSREEAAMKVQELYDRLAASNRELELAHLQLKEYTNKVEELAVSQERNRLAREIHDTLGHTLMGIIISLEAGRKLMDRDMNHAREEITKAQESARMGLQDVRRSIHALRPLYLEKHDFSHAIMKMIEEVKESTGLDVRLEIEGEHFLMTPNREVALYRSIQEALTNAVRHGKASIVDIKLAYENMGIRMMIRDNGKGCAHIMEGFGLIGMLERVQVMGGTVTYQSETGMGFHIHVFIPVRRDTLGEDKNIDCR